MSDGDINRYTDKNVSCGTNYYYAVTSYVGDNAYDTYVTTESVNYRTGPGTSYAKAGTLESDVQVKVDPSYKRLQMDIHGIKDPLFRQRLLCRFTVFKETIFCIRKYNAAGIRKIFL